MRRLAGVLVLAVGAAGPAQAAAPVQDCISASYEGQRLRGEGKYREAKALFTRCGADSCPSVIRSSCTEWHVEVDKLLPSISVAVRDGAGADVLDAQVTVDGVTVDARSGALVELDPGAHSIAVSSPRGKVDLELVLAAGEKGRPVVLNLAPVSTEPPVAVATSASRRSLVLPGLTTAVTGVGLVVFGIFGGMGLAGRDALAADPCAATLTCAPERTQAVRVNLIAADIALGVAVVAAVTSAVLWWRWASGGG